MKDAFSFTFHAAQRDQLAYCCVIVSARLLFWLIASGGRIENASGSIASLGVSPERLVVGVHVAAVKVPELDAQHHVVLVRQPEEAS